MIFSTTLSPLAPASAKSSDGSPFEDTKWVSTVHDQGSTSTVIFGADGKWSEVWRTEHHEGHWWTNKENTVLLVNRDDGRRLKFKIRPDNTLFREVGNIIYVKVAYDATPTRVTGQTSPSSPSEPTAPTVKLTEDQTRAVVLVKGDNAEGTGFLIKTADGPVVVTNIHVISNNPNLKIRTTTGTSIAILGCKGASDRDLTMIAVKDGAYYYLTLAADVSATAQAGDEVSTPGNSEGGEVMLNTGGKILGIGPDRIEFDNPVYHGNSGGPVIQVKSGKVIGVVTEATKVNVADELDKASFANKKSAIRNSIRYFGLRLDSVPAWESYDWKRLQSETAFLDKFDWQSRSLASYLNAAARTAEKHKKKKAHVDGPGEPDTTLYLSDEKIVRAIKTLDQHAAGADTAQQLDALRQFVADLGDIADTDMNAIQNPANFYSFDEMRAKDEIAYRKALKTALNSLGDNVGQLSELPRTNQ